MTIHTIGDSHAANGWSGIVPHHIGARLCYSFGRDKGNLFDIHSLNIKDGDSVIFCFGEIDCRCHIHKHITDTNTYENIINNVVDNYFEAIQIKISSLEVTLKNVCVYNVVPPIEKYNTYEQQGAPFLGTDEERKNYVLYFNKKLKEKCNEYHYVFFDIYDKYVDDHGFLRKDLSDNNVHIRNGVYITNFIHEHNI